LPFLHRCIGKGLSLLFRRGKVLFYPGGCHCKNASWIEGGGEKRRKIRKSFTYCPRSSIRPFCLLEVRLNMILS